MATLKGEERMAKGRPRGSKNKKQDQPKNEAESSTRVTVQKPNGQTSMAAAPAPAEGSGNIVLPTPEESQRVLSELAVLNTQAQKSGAKYEELAGLAKRAKALYEADAKAVLDRLRAATSPAPMPLFDAQQREEDQQKMELAAANGGEPPVHIQDTEAVLGSTAPIDEVF